MAFLSIFSQLKKYIAICIKIYVTENVNNFVDKVDKIWENSTLKC